MNPEIDIYAHNPVITLAYQIAVMQAATHGAKIQFRFRNDDWVTSPLPNWGWNGGEYRVNPICKPQAPKIAEGHNPDKLTEEQVGVKDGWRLLSEQERSAHRKVLTRQIQVWFRPGWNGYVLYHGDDINWTYRTKQPPGFFLPKKKKRVPLLLTDFPSIFWIRAPHHTGIKLVTEIRPDNSIGFGKYTVFLDQMVTDFEYSADRVNWKPCYKEVDDIS